MNKRFFSILTLSILSQFLLVSFNLGTISFLKRKLFEIKVRTADDQARELAVRAIQDLNDFPLGLNSFLLISVSIALISFLCVQTITKKRWQKILIVGLNLWFVILNVFSPLLS